MKNRKLVGELFCALGLGLIIGVNFANLGLTWGAIGVAFVVLVVGYWMRFVVEEEN